MKLFITGATGFIGSHFVRAAQREGHDVMALRRCGTSHPRIALEREPTWLTAPLSQVGAESFAGVNMLVHLAAAGVNTHVQDWQELIQTNVVDSMKLWIAAADAGVQHFVVCGSCFEYGRVAERYEFIATDAPLEPTTAYGVSKAAASMAAIALAGQRNLHMLIVRPFQVYGDGESANRLWPALRRAALAGEDFALSPGEQVRDFIPVEDAAAMILDACTRLNTEPGIAKIVNIGTGEPQTVRAFAESWWTKWKATGKLQFGIRPYRPGEVMRYVPLVETIDPVGRTH